MDINPTHLPQPMGGHHRLYLMLVDQHNPGATDRRERIGSLHQLATGRVQASGQMAGHKGVRQTHIEDIGCPVTLCPHGFEICHGHE